MAENLREREHRESRELLAGRGERERALCEYHRGVGGAVLRGKRARKREPGQRPGPSFVETHARPHVSRWVDVHGDWELGAPFLLRELQLEADPKPLIFGLFRPGLQQIGDALKTCISRAE